MDIQYYLNVRIPGIGDHWMMSGPLSLEDAYHGFLSLRDYQFLERDVEIKQRKGKCVQKISFNDLSAKFNSSPGVNSHLA